MNNESTDKLLDELTDSATQAIVATIKAWSESRPDDHEVYKHSAMIDALSAVRLGMFEILGVSVETLEKIVEHELDRYKRRHAEQS